MPWSIISASLAAYVPRDRSDDTVLFPGSTFEYLPTDGKANLADDIKTFYPDIDLQ